MPRSGLLAIVQTFFADDVHGNLQPPRGALRCCRQHSQNFSTTAPDCSRRSSDIIRRFDERRKLWIGVQIAAIIKCETGWLLVFKTDGTLRGDRSEGRRRATER